MKVFTSEIKVRYAETDQMGIVHHSRYYPWYEVARTEFLEDAVMSYKEMESMGIMLPVVNSHCEYKRPARYDDTVHIKTWIKELNKVKMVIAYECHIEGQLIATGYTTHPFVDLDFKLMNLGKKYPKLYAKLENCLG